MVASVMPFKLSSRAVSSVSMAQVLSLFMTVAGSSCPILLDPELLGHAGIETTQIYTHLDTSRLHQMVRDLHPLKDKEERTTAA